MLYPNPDMLLRIAQGDAYGVACEYTKPDVKDEILERSLKFETYDNCSGLRSPSRVLDPGCYTDDTQMSIAVSEVLLSGDFSREAFAESFVACFRRDPRKGYASGFQTLLDTTKTGSELLSRIQPFSDKNGAAMRSVPIGVLPDENAVVDVAGTQAKITHDTAGGRLSSITVALMSHYALYNERPFSELRQWLMNRWIDLRPWNGSPVKAMPQKGVGIATAEAVLQLLESCSTLIDVAKTCLTWGGDTDTVLSIAWGIASTRMKDELPDFMFNDLENKQYGRHYLIELGQKLMGKYNENHH